MAHYARTIRTVERCVQELVKTGKATLSEAGRPLRRRLQVIRVAQWARRKRITAIPKENYRQTTDGIRTDYRRYIVSRPRTEQTPFW